ncbi:MAG: hypothetical protein LBV47_00940, partial [Bacteroidales bacterium]|nr:hypothetical protein [Bacteroidales bacterium]
GKDSLYYTYCDYQGNLIAVTDAAGTVKERYAYDPWGQRVNPASWGEKDTRTSFLFSRGYTLHEHLDEFGLINMNGRMYDPLVAQFLSPDPYVQAPGNWYNYNRYAYCMNNPLIYTDPSGEFIFTVLSAIFCPWALPAAIYVDFFTDAGYQLQKTVSPVAFHVDLRSGSNQGGIGIDVSVGVPQMFPLSYRVHGGATYYWKNEDMLGNNMSGWETRYGAEWGISGNMFGVPATLTYSGTTYNSKWSGKQTTNQYMLGTPFINMKYENDMKPEGLRKYVPFVPKGDGDRYRTAAAQINVGPLGIGINLITGDAGLDREKYLDGKNYIANGEYNPDQYRMGVFYFRAGPFRFGRNSENVRHVFQNRFAHDFMTGGETKWFRVLDLKPRWWWQFGYSGGGTLW